MWLLGFAAKLTAEEAKAIEMREGVVLARPQRMVTLHTTHTPSFLRLQQNLGLWKQSNYGKGVIIGLVDSGIAPDHPSFNGEGIPPPPAKWKGKCELNGTLSCNNKLIGARNFATNRNDLVDREEHGTHTASTAAGSPVYGVSYFGQANGTAVGIAPLAHLTMHKISAGDGKAGESEFLAAFDAAVADGVDVLSLSAGIGSDPVYDDAIAIATHAAIQKGLFVSCSAGNEGPHYRTLSNEAPWLLTVGVSTVDRAIRATVLLGNNAELNGESLFQPKNFRPKLLPLVYAGAKCNASSASCDKGSLKNVNIKSKRVFCEGGNDTVSKGQEVKDNVADGVDVLSLSAGIGSDPVYDDAIAIATHAAIQKGLFVSCSAGNEGPHYRTLSNEAPWLLTVGVSTVDRAIRATVLLGNNAELNGESLFQPKNFRPKLLPLVYAGAKCNASSASCDKGSLKNVNIKSKRVFCEGGNDTVSKGQEVKDNGSAIKAYINSTSSPKSTILFKGTVVGLPEAPQVAWFSSRGPRIIASPGILKPDIIGPSVRILAAWPHSVGNITNRFEFLSGTSMSNRQTLLMQRSEYPLERSIQPLQRRSWSSSDQLSGVTTSNQTTENCRCLR
ncbi:hypothetical protein JCGZ_20713 [Jatropha curcas]|uniref:Peptidase S8/S53 domain-containing protein n=1 Tax=Jatropha curcas TaxID=180498 RepID=A0A067JNU3_JATCU|nr:hypothetical protein JCGZ_20713 [Jatropha curcas]